MKELKRAQIYGQVFIYVLTLVLISFILAYGYKSIQNLKTRAEQLSCLKFQKDLQNSIQTILSDFGTVKRKDLQLCSNYRQICFVETVRAFNKIVPNSNVFPVDPIIMDSIKSSTGKNVFLVSDTAKESFYAGNISMDFDVLCIDSSKSLRLEGKGSYAALSQWS